MPPAASLLLARLAISGGDQLKALGWLTGHRPDLASNLDYYATWAGLTQELGRNAEAAEIYVTLLRQQPDQGRFIPEIGPQDHAWAATPLPADIKARYSI